jgi:molecular chaperone HscB
MNHFELFGLAEGFELDTRQLADTYRQLQTQFHPDRFATAPSGSSCCRAACCPDQRCLYHPQGPLAPSRVPALLAGTDIRGEQQTLQDPAFLMQQLEWRERLADLKGDADPEGPSRIFARRSGMITRR